MTLGLLPFVNLAFWKCPHPRTDHPPYVGISSQLNKVLFNPDDSVNKLFKTRCNLIWQKSTLFNIFRLVPSPPPGRLQLLQSPVNCFIFCDTFSKCFFGPVFSPFFDKIMDSPLYVKWWEIVHGYLGIQEDCGRWGLTYLLAIIPTVSPPNHLTSCVVKSRETTFRRDHLDPAKHERGNLGGGTFCLGSTLSLCHLNVMARSGCSLGMRFHLWST